MLKVVTQKFVAVVTVVTGSDDDGSTDTREELKMTGVNCLEFTVGLGTCGSLIYSKPRTTRPFGQDDLG